MDTYDAILIGSGPNALANAAYLGRAGWKVLILEKNDRPGGGMRTDEITIPGFKHDVYAGYLILWALSQANRDFGEELQKRGLTMVGTSTPAGVSMPGGRSSVITTSMEANLAETERLSPGDGAGWGQMIQTIGQHAQAAFGLLSSDLTSPAARAGIGDLFTDPAGGLSPFAVEFLLSARDVLESRFQSETWRGILAPWVFHSGLGPESANSGFWTHIFALGLQSAGQFVAVGGTEMLAKALVQLIEDQGGSVLTGQGVTRILVEGGKAVGVRTDTGEEFRASRAVISSTNPDQLYLSLLADVPLPDPVKQQAQHYRYGHSVFHIHLALSEPPHWRDNRLDSVIYTHITDGLDGVSLNFNQTNRKLLPSDPVIGVGVPTVLDPSRAPAGKATAVLQVLDVPYRFKGDAAGEIDPGDGTWTAEVKNRLADRVIKQATQHIPNLASSIVGRAMIGPEDLVKFNPNWQGGDPYSGSHEIAQHYLLRPLAGQPGYETPIANLYRIGASTFPGLGLGGTSGMIVAQNLLKT